MQRLHICIVPRTSPVLTRCPLQVDALRPLRLPALLVADMRLGGISATLAAYEALLTRGYDVAAIVGLCDGAYSGTPAVSAAGRDVGASNFSFLAEHVASGPCRPAPAMFALPECPPAPPDESVAPGEIDSALRSWLSTAEQPLQSIVQHLHDWHAQRLARLSQMRPAAREALWWPFTQHATLGEGDVTLIDARDGENFTVVDAGAAEQQSDPALHTLYDGCASWWTQGVSAELQPLARQHLAYGAGRYGHVIFPEAVHEPALRLSERLLATVGEDWASRVFFSDDGCAALPAIMGLCVCATVLVFAWALCLYERSRITLRVTCRHGAGPRRWRWR